MHLTRLAVSRFRALSRVELMPGPAFNLFTGANAAGKTSLLEAVHCLAQGKSFLNAPLRSLVQHGASEFVVRATVADGGGGSHTLAVQRGTAGTARRLDGEPAATQAALARHLPLLVLAPDSIQLVGGAPAGRRALLDWGLFYAEPDFLATWRQYRHALRQRNALLRGGRVDGAALAAWEAPLAAAGERLHHWRAAYAEALAAALDERLAAFGLDWALSLRYRAGWARDVPLAEALVAARDTDRQRGFTGPGPHRADLALRLAGQPASERLSRGQQRVLVVLLKLAQAMLHVEHCGTSPVFLIDDLAAELDADNYARLVATLAGQGVQCLVTGTGVQAEPALPARQLRRFHVKHGAIVEVV